MGYLVGIDIGGTFTDCAIVDAAGRLLTTKVPSTPPDFAPDVLLLDIGLPQKSGYEIVRSLRERYGSARPVIVAITGRDGPAAVRLSEMVGFDRHFTKPVEPKELLATLSSLVP